MTTVTASTTYAKLGDAAGAAKQLRLRLATVVHGSNDETALYDLRAFAAMLETGAAAFTLLQDSRPYTLSLTTAGTSDAVTKAVAAAWVYDTPSPPKSGLNHASGHSLAPKLGADLLALINAL